MEMGSLADALVYAVTFINIRGGEGDENDERDLGALESIAAMLASATEEEKNALAAAAERALASESANAPREEFVRIYSTWMEDMFGDEWTGNERSA